MSGDRKTLKRTVFYDERTGELCTCEGNFWKTCSLRVANILPCQEALISITPISRTDNDPALDSVRILDKKLSDLTNQLRHIKKFPKI